jgi:hypothetical protein
MIAYYVSGKDIMPMIAGHLFLISGLVMSFLDKEKG